MNPELTSDPPRAASQHAVAVVRKPQERAGIQVAWERLFVAIGYLATASGTLQYRLDCAYTRCIAPLLGASLPSDIREELLQVVAILAGTDSHTNEKAVRMSIANLPEAQAKEAARRLLSLFNLVARSHPLNR